MKGVDGKGQVCLPTPAQPPAPAPVLFQIKILQSGEEASREFRCCWVSEKRALPGPTRVPEILRDLGKIEKACIPPSQVQPGTVPAMGMIHLNREHGCVHGVWDTGCQRQSRFKSWVRHRGEPPPPLQAGHLSQLRDRTSLFLGLGDAGVWW